MKKCAIFLFAVFCLGLPSVFRPGLFAGAQAMREWDSGTAQGSPAELPLRRIALFSSGVAYFEHSGTVAPSTTGNTEITLPFEWAAMNDVLMSLVINDPASTAPSVRYASENTLWRALRSLRIDLSGMPGITEILGGLRGAELEVSAPNPVRGRIIGVEFRQSDIAVAGQAFHARAAGDAWLSLFTPQGIRVIAVGDIISFRFMDERINADLNRALDLILASQDNSTQSLTVTLDGTVSRAVSISYVIPAPVWKVSYRLDLGREQPFLQGWAIVDNDSDTDWEGVELSLVTGRPASFIQNLFQPYHVFRPVLPLAIAGAAEGRAHEPGITLMARTRASMMPEEPAAARQWAEADFAPMPQAAAPAVAGGVMQTAEGVAAGEQFLFTFNRPVTLQRRQSAMLPLVEGSVQAERTLIFSGARALSGATAHPEIGAELTNTSGISLPAGPITVYDGGIFAGHALIEFFPEGERRFITFGQDLSVTGNVTSSAARHIAAVNLSGGVMTISRRQSHERVYTIRNASDEERRIIIEHPVIPGAELVQPANAEERTAALYRFNRTIGARETLTLTVREETPISEQVTLAHLHENAFLHFATSHEIPANVRAVLTRAIELRRIAAAAAAVQSELERERAWLISEQERTRHNLEAVGVQSPQGQEFLNRLVALDNEIGGFTARVNEAAREAQRTRSEYEDFLAAITI
ncbi:MAG: DUF4139 domain-containing protein [Treponema sp.]|nr:DUF4139 domain-containing protein [Treponema sp.]